jgi:hypothetical protein
LSDMREISVGVLEGEVILIRVVLPSRVSSQGYTRWLTVEPREVGSPHLQLAVFNSGGAEACSWGVHGEFDLPPMFWDTQNYVSHALFGAPGTDCLEENYVTVLEWLAKAGVEFR